MIKCDSLAEVRAEIDVIDAKIIVLLAERQGYVGQAAGFKHSVEEVPAPARVEAVIDKVTTHARAVGASPEVVEAVYRTMIAAFIRYETVQHQART